MTTHEIQSAINAAECVTRPLAGDNEPVTVTNKTLLALIKGANLWLEDEAFRERVKERHRETGDIDD